jgi:hypothetical protein
VRNSLITDKYRKVEKEVKKHDKKGQKRRFEKKLAMGVDRQQAAPFACVKQRTKSWAAVGLVERQTWYLTMSEWQIS